jgi:hypothetical protein
VKKPKTRPAPAPSNLTVLRQFLNFIPTFLVPSLAKDTGVDKQSRTFSAWSHVVALIYAQLIHAVSLNDLCDALRLNSGPLSALRGATPPSKNNLSHANKLRDAALAEKIFWSVLEHLKALHPRFAGSRSGRRVLRRFNRVIHVVDSTTIQLVAACMDWAKHRRRKAAAKCHLRLDLQSFLPRFAIVDTAKHHDNKRAREVCAGVKDGEIILFDKAYVDFGHLFDLVKRGVAWVTRAKDNMQFRVVKRQQWRRKGNILRDELIELKTKQTRGEYPEILRRVVALVELDGREVEMTFLTNNLEWSANTVAELYRCRWAIEVFFKQMKQTLQLGDFLGQSANAVRWQVWMALLTYVLLRFMACLSEWEQSFGRLCTLIRAALWKRLDLVGLLKGYGTAGGHFRYMAQPEQAYFAGI